MMIVLLWTNHPDAYLLERYALGLLIDEFTVACIEEHIVLCEECQREVTVTRAVATGLQTEAG